MWRYKLLHATGWYVVYVFSVGFLDTRLIGMVHLGVLVFAVAVSSTSIACPGTTHDHDHEYARRALPPARLPIPKRPLEWGDVNVIHTTDSHGWLLGHQKATPPEPDYR